ncbi:hypothetical protein [Microbispora rosea]|uniref:hypothetical protein n=1 Tax=Microbispora rosea TaxID=58117 RepID=UPI000A858BF9|nr:hypothetical protein [Microbispora rosea]
MGKDKSKKKPVVVTSKDGKSQAVFHGKVGKTIEAKKIKGGVHLTLDESFWK